MASPPNAKGSREGEDRRGSNDVDGPDELKRVLGRKLENGMERSGYRRIRGEIAPHRVQRDSRQARLPELLLAASRHSSRTRRRRGADDASPGSAGMPE